MMLAAAASSKGTTITLPGPLATPEMAPTPDTVTVTDPRRTVVVGAAWAGDEQAETPTSTTSTNENAATIRTPTRRT